MYIFSFRLCIPMLRPLVYDLEHLPLEGFSLYMPCRFSFYVSTFIRYVHYCFLFSLFELPELFLSCYNVSEVHTQTTAGMQNFGPLHSTPQQNGVAECKNRHLLDITRTLLFCRHVLKEYWGDVILIACYLINRISSFVLQNRIPYLFCTQIWICSL